VLDLCAAPGGKTAQLVKAGYSVVALDREPARVDRLKANLTRLGYAPQIITADALIYTSPEQFDGILLDAPCSATGTFRRHPEVLLNRDRAAIASLVAAQRRFIARAAQGLKPGGVLIYCVCSLEPLEGEAQAQWALDASLGLAPLPITAGELGWAEAVTPDGYVRTHPGLTFPPPGFGTLDGFFVARFRKL
jgi:16S rRNA (cytosine967-C5)-methyltransferase